MPVKTKVDEAEKVDVHHMIRRVGKRETESGTRTVDQVDADVRNWLEAGYKLFSTHNIGLEAEGVNILYIFIKQ